MSSHASVERNVRYLIIEMFWAAIAAAGYSFAAAYVIRLGGSNFIVSLITTAAAVVNAVTTIPFAAMMERTEKRKPWIFGSLIAFRMLHIFLIFVPFLPAWRAEAIVIILLVANLPVALFNAGWLPMFADIVPIQRRARLFSARNVTLGATMMVGTYVFGLWLEYSYDMFPLNYQLLFTMALITSMLSTFYVMKLDIPDTPIDTSVPVDRSIKGMLTLFSESKSYSAITWNTLIFNIEPWAAIALQPIYFVRELGATDQWLGIWFAITNGGAIVGNLIWPRLMEKHGFQKTMTAAALLSSLYFFILLQVCSPQRRALAMGVFVTIMNLGLMGSSLLVAPMIDLIGAQTFVIVLGGLRLFGALLFVVNPIFKKGIEPPQR